MAAASFTQSLEPAALKYFNSIGEQPFSKQAVAFLNSCASLVEKGDGRLD